MWGEQNPEGKGSATYGQRGNRQEAGYVGLCRRFLAEKTRAEAPACFNLVILDAV